MKTKTHQYGPITDAEKKGIRERHTETAAQGQNVRDEVCPNCQQWQNWTSKGYYDCFHDCAERGLTAKRPTAAEAPREAQERDEAVKRFESPAVEARDLTTSEYSTQAAIAKADCSAKAPQPTEAPRIHQTGDYRDTVRWERERLATDKAAHTLSTSRKWERLAEEAIEDSGYWKQEARNAQGQRDELLAAGREILYSENYREAVEHLRAAIANVEGRAQ